MKNIKEFQKKARPVRVIQFGEGGFLRGFVDWMLQKLNDKGLFNGSVAVVQPIEKGMCDLLSSQNCLYTHIIRGAEGLEKTVIDVIDRCVKPYEDFDAYLALAENPDARFIVSNTTESGIEFRAADMVAPAVVTGDTVFQLYHTGRKFFHHDLYAALPGGNTFLTEHSDFCLCCRFFNG